MKSKFSFEMILKNNAKENKSCHQIFCDFTLANDLHSFAIMLMILYRFT